MADPIEELNSTKENIQPLKKGRVISHLANALSAQKDVEAHTELLRQREKYEMALRTYEGDDPLEQWYEYVSWVEQNFLRDSREGNLNTVLERCLKQFKDDERYHQDTRYIELWVKYIEMQFHPLEIYKKCLAHGIGKYNALLYVAYAHELENNGDHKRADQVFAEGLKNNAQPRDQLEKAREVLQLRVARAFLDGNTDVEATRAEQRSALNKLRAHGNRKNNVSNIRTGLTAVRGPAGILHPLTENTNRNGNTKSGLTKVYDEEENASTAEFAVAGKHHLVNVPRSELINKENMLKPGPWTGKKSKHHPTTTTEAILPHRPLRPAFDLHEDEDAGQQGCIASTVVWNALQPRKLDMDEFNCPVAVFEPEDPTKCVKYCKDKVYAGGSEYSFEELRALEYAKGNKPKQKKQASTEEELNCPIAYFEPPDPTKRPMYCKHLVYSGGTEFSFEELRARKYNRDYEWKRQGVNVPVVTASTEEEFSCPVAYFEPPDPKYTVVTASTEEEFSCPVAYFEPPDPTKRPMYCKNLVYNEGTEFSFEELRARKYNRNYELKMQGINVPDVNQEDITQPTVSKLFGEELHRIKLFELESAFQEKQNHVMEPANVVSSAVCDKSTQNSDERRSAMDICQSEQMVNVIPEGSKHENLFRIHMKHNKPSIPENSYAISKGATCAQSSMKNEDSLNFGKDINSAIVYPPHLAMNQTSSQSSLKNQENFNSENCIINTALVFPPPSAIEQASSQSSMKNQDSLNSEKDINAAIVCSPIPAIKETSSVSPIKNQNNLNYEKYINAALPYLPPATKKATCNGSGSEQDVINTALAYPWSLEKKQSSWNGSDGKIPMPFALYKSPHMKSPYADTSSGSAKLGESHDSLHSTSVTCNTKEAFHIVQEFFTTPDDKKISSNYHPAESIRSKAVFPAIPETECISISSKPVKDEPFKVFNDDTDILEQWRNDIGPVKPLQYGQNSEDDYAAHYPIICNKNENLKSKDVLGQFEPPSVPSFPVFSDNNDNVNIKDVPSQSKDSAPPFPVFSDESEIVPVQENNALEKKEFQARKPDLHGSDENSLDYLTNQLISPDPVPRAKDLIYSCQPDEQNICLNDVPMQEKSSGDIQVPRESIPRIPSPGMISQQLMALEGTESKENDLPRNFVPPVRENRIIMGILKPNPYFPCDPLSDPAVEEVEHEVQQDADDLTCNTAAFKCALPSSTPFTTHMKQVIATQVPASVPSKVSMNNATCTTAAFKYPPYSSTPFTSHSKEVFMNQIPPSNTHESDLENATCNTMSFKHPLSSSTPFTSHLNQILPRVNQEAHDKELPAKSQEPDYVKKFASTGAVSLQFQNNLSTITESRESYKSHSSGSSGATTGIVSHDSRSVGSIASARSEVLLKSGKYITDTPEENHGVESISLRSQQKKCTERQLIVENVYEKALHFEGVELERKISTSIERIVTLKEVTQEKCSFMPIDQHVSKIPLLQSRNHDSGNSFSMGNEQKEDFPKNIEVATPPIASIEKDTKIHMHNRSAEVGSSLALELSRMKLEKEPDIDPFDERTIELLLKEIDFETHEYADHYFELDMSLPRFRSGGLLSLGNDKYTVVSCVGEGNYAKVFKGIHQNTEKTVALKVQKPSWKWEFYICQQIQMRLADPVKGLAFMNIHKAYILENSSIMVTDFCHYGSLLSFINQTKQKEVQIPETLMIYWMLELINIIELLQKCCIIHGDIKPDNILIRCPPALNPGHPSLQLIDMGRSIDMTLFPEGTTFNRVVTTKGFQCIEMQTKRPWTYQTDLYGIAGTMHVILFADYMKVRQINDKWFIQRGIPRYSKQHLWKNFFFSFLNVESCENLPDFTELKIEAKEEISKSDISSDSTIKYIFEVKTDNRRRKQK